MNNRHRERKGEAQPSLLSSQSCSLCFTLTLPHGEETVLAAPLAPDLRGVSAQHHHYSPALFENTAGDGPMISFLQPDSLASWPLNLFGWVGGWGRGQKSGPPEFKYWLTSQMPLGKQSNSKPQFTHLQNRDDNSTDLTRLLWGFNVCKGLGIVNGKISVSYSRCYFLLFWICLKINVIHCCYYFCFPLS